MERKVLLYDKSGEEHFNLISALHKSVRSSDPDAALYWLARMLESGEDRLYIARRLVRMAIEDIGLADPRALEQTMAAQQAVHFLGIPEGDLALAQAAIYLAVAPKSDAAYKALDVARADVATSIAEPVPLHLRNAPTPLMKQFGYGEGYQHAHKFEDALTDMECLPPSLAGRRYYYPTNRGLEKRIAERLEEIREGSGRSSHNNGRCHHGLQTAAVQYFDSSRSRLRIQDDRAQARWSCPLPPDLLAWQRKRSFLTLSALTLLTEDCSSRSKTSLTPKLRRWLATSCESMAQTR